jgi:hypothetical protein
MLLHRSASMGCLWDLLLLCCNQSAAAVVLPLLLLLVYCPLGQNACSYA